LPSLPTTKAGALLHSFGDGEQPGAEAGAGTGPIFGTAAATVCYWACACAYTVFLFFPIYVSRLDDFEIKARAQANAYVFTSYNTPTSGQGRALNSAKGKMPASLRSPVIPGCLWGTLSCRGEDTALVLPGVPCTCHGFLSASLNSSTGGL